MFNLPSQIILQQLIERFFQTFNVWFPILHYSSVKILAETYNEISEEDATLLHAITTVTLRFIPDDVLFKHDRQRQRELSIDRVKSFVLHRVSMRTLQSIAILCVDAFGVDRMPGLLGFLRTQFDTLYAHNAGPYHDDSESSSSCIADGWTVDSSMIEAECFERVRLVMNLLEKSCSLTTNSRPQFTYKRVASIVDHARITSAYLPAESPRLPDGTQELDEKRALNEHLHALNLLSDVLDFGQTSFSSHQPAKQERWRREYAGLRLRLNRIPSAQIRMYGHANIAYYGTNRDNSTVPIIYHASLVYLHAIAIQVFNGAGWNSQLPTQEWRNAISKLLQNVGDVSVEQLNPFVAFCLWIACQAITHHPSVCHGNISLALAKFVAIIERMGNFWNIAKLYADQLNDTAFIESIDAYLESEAKTWIPQTPSSEVSPNESAGTPDSMLVPDVITKEDMAFLSYFDWSRFETDVSSDETGRRL